MCIRDRVERDGERRNDDGASENDEERADGGENRAVNEEVNQGEPRCSSLISHDGQKPAAGGVAAGPGGRGGKGNTGMPSTRN